MPAIPRLADATGARADITPGACSTKPGTVEVVGKVHNPTSKTTDYAITVSWINARSDVRARDSVLVKALGPGATRSWKARTRLRAKNATQCTFFVQRGSVEGR